MLPSISHRFHGFLPYPSEGHPKLIRGLDIQTISMYNFFRQQKIKGNKTILWGTKRYFSENKVMHNIPSSLKLLKIILVPLLVLSCSTRKMQEPKTEIDINIPVVYNPENPEPLPGTPSKIALKEELCLKYEEGKTNLFPSEMGYVAVDDEGNFFVTDGKEHAVKVFNRDGELVRTFGNKRVTSPYIRIVKRKGIMIFDERNNRIFYYSAEGQCLEEVSTEKYKDVNIGGPQPDSRGNIIAIFGHYKGRPGWRAGWGDLKRTYIRDLVKVDPNFNSALVISSREWPQTSRFDMPWIFPSFTYEVRKDDSIVWGKTNPEYEFFITNSEGKTIKKIVKEHSPRKITEEDKKEIINNRYKGKSPGYRLTFDEYFPSFRRLRCDDEGKIYVQTYEKDKNDLVFWDVFDREGRYITKFSLSKREIIFDIKKNYMYSHSDYREYRELTPFVKRYRINWE